MHTQPFLRRRLLAALVASALAPAMSFADFPGHETNGAARHDHDRARHALQQGEVRPIAEILQRVADEVPGEVIEVELERKKWLGTGRWVYEIKLIAPDGRLVEVLVDASTAEMLAVEED
ncbi:PepSY domain-containing protein [Thiocapsa sp.]|uniref:PepSY domain-containing protein n=1 Tax=Thiocapsa sp. TaxID=2024551 RepID=UPI0035930656